MRATINKPRLRQQLLPTLPLLQRLRRPLGLVSPRTDRKRWLSMLLRWCLQTSLLRTSQRESYKPRTQKKRQRESETRGIGDVHRAEAMRRRSEKAAKERDEATTYRSAIRMGISKRRQVLPPAVSSVTSSSAYTSNLADQSFVCYVCHASTKVPTRATDPTCPWMSCQTLACRERLHSLWSVSYTHLTLPTIYSV